MFGFKKKKISGNNDRAIYELIKKSIGDSGELPHNFNLPSNSNGKLKFAAGAMDGIRTRHSELKGSECGELYGLVKKYNGDISAIEDFFNENHALETADSFFEETVKRGEIKPFQLYRLACGLTMTSGCAEAVKFGIMLFELAIPEDTRQLTEICMTLGLCDEFTLYSCFVFRHLENGNELIFRLAQHVHGWGKIHAVSDFLAPDNDEIRRWLLRCGCKNSVLDAYLALAVSEKLGLPALLAERTDFDPDERRGIGDIMLGLMDEGPCMGISHYDDPTDMFSAYFDILGGAAASPTELAAATEIRTWLDENGMGDKPCRAKADAVINDSRTHEMIRQAFDGEYSSWAFQLADNAGIDIAAEAEERVLRDVQKNYYLIRFVTPDEEAVERIGAAVREQVGIDGLERLPLTEIMGIGPEYGGYNAVTEITRAAAEHPLCCVDIVKKAMFLKVNSCRYTAVSTVERWLFLTEKTLSELDGELYEEMKRLSEAESNEGLLKRVRLML